MKVFRVNYFSDEYSLHTTYAVCDREEDIPGTIARRLGCPEQRVRVSLALEIELGAVFLSELTMADFLKLTRVGSEEKEPEDEESENESGMKIKITVYKESGKYYTEDIVENETNIPMYKDDFKWFVIKNLPARLGEGYVVVEDMSNNQSFHQGLYKYSDLYGGEE